MHALGTEIRSQVKVVPMIDAVAITTVSTKTSVAVDREGYRTLLAAFVVVEAVGLAETFEVEDIAVTHSDTSDGTYVAYDLTKRVNFADDVTVTGVTGGATAVPARVSINLDGAKRWIKLAFTGTSSAGTTTAYVLGLLGGADITPTV